MITSKKQLRVENKKPSTLLTKEATVAKNAVPQTDTGELVEYTKALERTMLKELGKMTP